MSAQRTKSPQEKKYFAHVKIHAIPHTNPGNFRLGGTNFSLRLSERRWPFNNTTKKNTQPPQHCLCPKNETTLSEMPKALVRSPLVRSHPDCVSVTKKQITTAPADGRSYESALGRSGRPTGLPQGKPMLSRAFEVHKSQRKGLNEARGTKRAPLHNPPHATVPDSWQFAAVPRGTPVPAARGCS